MKSNRQEKILELIKNKIFLTQEDLQNELLALGYNVTQSTVSRDIKELRIVKGHDAEGHYRYIANEPAAAVMQNRDRYKELFSRSVISVAFSLNNVVIKCYTGMAQSACVTVDDTIIIVTAGEPQSARLALELNKLLK